MIDELKRYAAIQKCSVDELLHELTEVNTEKAYDDWLDEVYGQIEICGLKYYASNALESVDPIAYRCGFSDWLDMQCRDDIFFESPSEKYYWYGDVENLIECLEDRIEDAVEVE